MIDPGFIVSVSDGYEVSFSLGEVDDHDTYIFRDLAAANRFCRLLHSAIQTAMEERAQPDDSPCGDYSEEEMIFLWIPGSSRVSANGMKSKSFLESAPSAVWSAGRVAGA